MIGLQKNLGFVGDFCSFVPWDASSCFKPLLKGDLFVLFELFGRHRRVANLQGKRGWLEYFSGS